jgi:ribose/xylose/arabinose/galactoside ABC-type transport system permease subunit
MTQPPTAVAAPFAPPPRPPVTRSRGLVAHLGWEAILLVLVLLTAVVVAATGTLFRGASPWYNLASAGLLASAFALSLRTATPNLAVGSVAVLSGATYAKLVENDVAGVLAGIVAVLVALLLGLVLGLVAGLTSTPAWAVSLAGLALAQGIAFGLLGGLSVPTGSGPGGTGRAIVWMLVFLAVSVGGGVLWQIPAVRAALGANRIPDDPVRFRAAKLTGALAGLGGSSLLAGLSGVVLVTYIGVATPTTGDNLLLAAGAALLGGVSAFGGRGGIAGTALATALLVFANHGLLQQEAPRWVTFYLPAALAILLGVVVGRLTEKIAGPYAPHAPAHVPPAAGPGWGAPGGAQPTWHR